MWLLGVTLDLLAEPVDVGIDSAGLNFDLVTPDLAQQLPTTDHLAGLRGQQGEEIELGRRESDFLVLAPDLAAVHVDDEAGELEARLGLRLRHRLLAPPQVGTHSSQE